MINSNNNELVAYNCSPSTNITEGFEQNIPNSVPYLPPNSVTILCLNNKNSKTLDIDITGGILSPIPKVACSIYNSKTFNYDNNLCYQFPFEYGMKISVPVFNSPYPTFWERNFGYDNVYYVDELTNEDHPIEYQVKRYSTDNNGKISYSPSINNKPYIFTIPGISEIYDANVKKNNTSFSTYWIRLYGIDPSIDTRKFDNKRILYQINIVFAPYNTFVKNALAK